MTDFNPYEYSFFSTQSLALDQIPPREEIPPQRHTHDADIHHAISSFVRVECFKSEEVIRFTSGIVRHPAFTSLGLHLFEVSLIEFGLSVVVDRQERLETLRENIYDSLQELSGVLGKEKEVYIDLIPLIYYAILKKMFTVSKKLLNATQKFKIFHLVFFELKGKLVSDKYLEELVSRHFNDNYNKFIVEYSENITPLKSKHDRSLKRSEIVESECRFKRVGKENNVGESNYKTNKLILSKMTQSKKQPPEPRRREGFGGILKR